MAVALIGGTAIFLCVLDEYARERQARKPGGETMKTKKTKLKCKRLQKNEYIIFETGGRRTYLVHDRRRAKEIMHDYRKYGATPF